MRSGNGEGVRVREWVGERERERVGREEREKGRLMEGKIRRKRN